MDSVMGLFCSKKKKSNRKPLRKYLGRGDMQTFIIGGQEWDNGKDGVKRVARPRSLGAKLHCKYGGEIEIVHSGQQEAGGEG
ncbi:hypothetical protein [Enterocloster sp.]|uniref:hypothetical protein n=1 Tax=Enterocloster sp. TaxID=2719315 RepID=UPI0039A39211